MSDREFLLLSATEPDRLGLVAELTRFIAEKGCNVEDSRIVVLGGYAGLMVLVSGDPTALQGLLDGLDELRERHGIRLAPRRVAARRSAQPAAPEMVVHAQAIDHPGIIHALSDIVRQFGGNILELESASESAPQSGEPLFRLRMTVRLPPAVDSAHLWRELEAAATSQGVDLEVHAAPAPAGETVAHGPERRAQPRPS
ncbi:MAG TPA: ACT domain-containing protein [Gemmatimonadales bacterium]|nr:ACT domain-containing protein [Gemmatimonadales bacterium]